MVVSIDTRLSLAYCNSFKLHGRLFIIILSGGVMQYAIRDCKVAISKSTIARLIEVENCAGPLAGKCSRRERGFPIEWSATILRHNPFKLFDLKDTVILSAR